MISAAVGVRSTASDVSCTTVDISRKCSDVDVRSNAVSVNTTTA
jgi:hypothetical protein